MPGRFDAVYTKDMQAKRQREGADFRRNCAAFGVSGMLIHGDNFVLCTAKEEIHPQCPQAYPQIHRGKVAESRGFHRSYPQYPQDIHNPYPQWDKVWIFTGFAPGEEKRGFTNVTKMNKNSCSCMFGPPALPHPVAGGAENHR